MFKNIKILIISIIILLILNSCGFKQVNNKDSELVYFEEVNVTGDRIVSYAIKNDILLMSKSGSKNNYKVEIKTSKNKNIKIKDKSGKVIRYNLSIVANLELTDLDNKNKIKKTFVRNNDFDVAKNHSATINNEKSTIKNIVTKLSDEIISYIIIVIRNK